MIRRKYLLGGLDHTHTPTPPVPSLLDLSRAQPNATPRWDLRFISELANWTLAIHAGCCCRWPKNFLCARSRTDVGGVSGVNICGFMTSVKVCCALARSGGKLGVRWFEEDRKIFTVDGID